MAGKSQHLAMAAALCAGVAAPACAQETDLALVLAADISYSVGLPELDLQRRGYVDAFRSPEVIDAIRSGLHGRIAVTYLEWGGPGMQVQLLPWTILDGPAAARDFAEALEAAPLSRSGETSISAALDGAMALLADAPKAARHVIDLSADGYNNAGDTVTGARDRALAHGVTINGLPILTADAPDLDLYFRDCVIGGPGALLLTAARPEDFASALRRKLVSEIAGHAPERIYHAALTDCRIGERRARRDYLRQLDDLTHGRPERWLPPEEDWPEPD